MNFLNPFVILIAWFFWDNDPPHIKATHKITSEYVKRIEKEYQMRHSGGGGALCYDIKKVTIAFDSDATPTLEESRKFHVFLVTELLKLYNNDESVRPYLHNYPFTAKNLTIQVFYNDKRPNVVQDQVYTVNMDQGKFTYQIKYEGCMKDFSLKNYYHETFEEAYFKVHGRAWAPE